MNLENITQQLSDSYKNTIEFLKYEPEFCAHASMLIATRIADNLTSALYFSKYGTDIERNPIVKFLTDKYGIYGENLIFSLPLTGLALTLYYLGIKYGTEVGKQRLHNIVKFGNCLGIIVSCGNFDAYISK